MIYHMTLSIKFRAICAATTMFLIFTTIKTNAQSAACERIGFTSYGAASPSPLLTNNKKIELQVIDAVQLAEKMAADRGEAKHLKLQVIVSSSTGCGGTQGARVYMNKLKAMYGDSVLVYFIVGDERKRCQDYLTVINDLAPSILIYSAAEKYIDKRDAREGSDRLTKELFPASKDDIIGTPKFLIVDGKTGELLFHGMRGYKNPYPENVVEHFMSLK